MAVNTKSRLITRWETDKINDKHATRRQTIFNNLQTKCKIERLSNTDYPFILHQNKWIQLSLIELKEKQIFKLINQKSKLTMKLR